MNIEIELNNQTVETLISMSFSDEFEGDWKFDMFSENALVKIITFLNEQLKKEQKELQRHKMCILKNCCFLKYLEKSESLSKDEIQESLIRYQINLNDYYFKTKQNHGYFYNNNLSMFFFIKTKDTSLYFSKIYQISYGYQHMVEDLSSNKILQKLFIDNIKIEDFKSIKSTSENRLTPSLMAFIKVTMIDSFLINDNLLFLEGLRLYKNYFTKYDFEKHLIEGNGINANRLLLVEEEFKIDLSKNKNYNIAQAILNKIE